MKRYITLLFTTIAIGFIGVVLLLSYRYWVIRDLSNQDIAISQITKYQEQKIKNLSPGVIDTVFLGDSSLGNALDTKLFDQQLGTKSINLALTGGHGQAGALVLLRELAKTQPKIKNVILFFAVDGMAWGINPIGRFYMSAIPIEPALPIIDQLILLFTYIQRLTDGKEALRYLWKIIIGKTHISLPSSIYINDYIISNSKINVNSENVKNYKMPTSVTPESTLYLKEIGHLCKKNNWQCIYTQGPILANILTGNKDQEQFLESSIVEIRSAGFHLANERPFLMSGEDRGDTIFHLAHSSRPDFTNRYGKLIAPLLK